MAPPRGLPLRFAWGLRQKAPGCEPDRPAAGVLAQQSTTAVKDKKATPIDDVAFSL